MNRVPRLRRSAILGLVPSPSGLGSRLAIGPPGLILDGATEPVGLIPQPCRAGLCLATGPPGLALDAKGEVHRGARDLAGLGVVQRKRPSPCSSPKAS
jgi:hypothetical protein